MTHSTITSKGQTTAFIKDKLRDAATDDAVDKEALNLALSFLQSLANQQLKLPESGIAKKIESGSGKLSKGLKLARIIRGEEQRPLDQEGIGQRFSSSLAAPAVGVRASVSQSFGKNSASPRLCARRI